MKHSSLSLRFYVLLSLLVPFPFLILSFLCPSPTALSPVASSPTLPLLGRGDCGQAKKTFACLLNRREVVLFHFPFSSAQAQETGQFDIDAQLRTRGEYNNGALFPRIRKEGAAYFANERARLSCTYTRSNLQLKVSAQHTGVWGQDDINTRNGRVAMNEAWARVNLGYGFSAQVGRQQLSYDDERLLGAQDWNVAGYWHDALRMVYEHNRMTAHAVITLNQTAENVRGHYQYSGGMPYKALAMLWWHQDFDVQPVGISLLAMNLGMQAGEVGTAKTWYMQTLGTHVTYRPEDFDVAASFYMQTGNDKAGKRVSAFMASIRGSYDITPQWSARAGYDYLSGNDGRNTNQHAFNPLYGSYHKFLGAMDYFTSMVECGIQDIQLGVTTHVTKPVSVSLDYHGLFCAEKMGKRSKTLGHELDLHASMKLQSDVTISAGYSRMFGSATTDFLKGGDHHLRQDWLWAQLSVSPRLFTSKK